VLAVVALVSREPARPRTFGGGEAPIADEEQDREQPDEREQDDENEQQEQHDVQVSSPEV